MATTSATDAYDQTVDEIEETLGIVPGFFGDLNQDDLVDEWPTFKRMALAETEIPAKYKELINLAVAANLKCPYCIHFHREAAKLHGATEGELAEVSFLAGYTPRYSSMIHAQEYDLGTFKNEFGQIAAHLQSQMPADD
ncbi:carboxymuconolactone decarboxylase family protein [Halobaculum marinum]|uniref:Carboxymuconolactone decarboxylase family protein n=1 Tax=Halobaculum marinum TaxID=3031996 RepID=A0ABD5WYS5_9EURY|nr:carboxymuconolactone decarboxylase family protein [Halobaculum sp. DT55]